MLPYFRLSIQEFDIYYKSGYYQILINIFAYIYLVNITMNFDAHIFR